MQNIFKLCSWILVKLMSKSEYPIIPKGTKFMASGKLWLTCLLLIWLIIIWLVSISFSDNVITVLSVTIYPSIGPFEPVLVSLYNAHEWSASPGHSDILVYTWVNIDFKNTPSTSFSFSQKNTPKQGFCAASHQIWPLNLLKTALFLENYWFQTPKCETCVTRCSHMCTSIYMTAPLHPGMPISLWVWARVTV